MVMLSPVARLRSQVRYYFRQPERVSPSQWCEKHIYLPPGKQESEPGRVRFTKRPYLREPIDAFADPTVSDIVLAGPTRVGKTFFLRMGFAWSIAGDPAAMLWVDSTEDKAKGVSKKELQPLVEANVCLRERKPQNRHLFTDLNMLFPGASFTMVGGNSEAQVAGDTVKRVFGNELDKWKGASDKEAAIAELVRHRTETFDDERKHAWSSTPTLEEMQTWQYFLRGDQRKWFCPCPRCGECQELVWDQVWWDPEARIGEHKWDLHRVKASARYRCINASCSAHEGPQGWTDAERVAAVQDERSHWRATAIGEPGWRSYHVGGLYGPLKSNNVGALAVDFLSARNTGFYHDRQDFWNSRMGLPWRDDISVVTVEKFAARERQYRRGALPEGFVPALVITGFDVQSSTLPYVTRAMDWAGNSYLVDHGTVGAWTDLEAVQTTYLQRWPTARHYVIGDMNYEDRRAETLEQIYQRSDRGWFAAEGFEFSKERVRLESANVYLGGKLQAEQHRVVKLAISTYDFKVELEKRMSGELANWFCYQLELTADEQEREEQADYYRQMLDERRVPRKRRVQGKPPFEFKPRTKYNHAFDCEVYILALFWVLRARRPKNERKAGGERKVVEVRR